MNKTGIRFSLAAGALLLVSACSRREVPSLTGCIRDRLAEVGGAKTPQQLEAVTGICYDLLADQEHLRRLAATAGIYEDQLYQNHVLLWIVVVITLSGVLLAGIQLIASYQLAKSGKGVLADGGEVALAPGNAVVKSSVVGVVILAISLGFFMVFVSEVYKITPAAASATPRTGRAVVQTTAQSAVQPAGQPKGKQIPR